MIQKQNSYTCEADAEKILPSRGRAATQRINTGYRIQKDYQLTKLLLAVEPEIPNNNNKLARERNPEGG